MLWLLLLITASHAKQLFRARCEAFVPETYVYNSSRHVLEYIPAGTNLSLPDNDPTCARPNQTTAVDLCRVALLVPTTNRSSISFELWLPDNWTGRFLATGNGGIDGCKYGMVEIGSMQHDLRWPSMGLSSQHVGIKYEDLAYTTQHGFASVGSNNGHNGTTLKAMYWNLDVVTDYSWRSYVVASNCSRTAVSI